VLLFIGVVVLFVAAGCSSAPKGPVETRTQRRTALKELETADKEADRGNYENALSLVDGAQRFAVSADDSTLIIRTALSRGNILSYLNRAEEAQAAFDGALAEAERVGDTELAAVSRIYIARSRLLGAAAGSNAAAIAGNLLDQVRKDLSLIKKEQTAAALGWTVIGLAEKALGHWTDAEKGIRNALDIHVKGASLESAAYDWYLIASIRSVSASYQGALDALEEALGYDRRAENTYGLGTDWKAMGDVYTKMGNKTAADMAYRRAAEIFRSINMEKEAAGMDQAL
jgi:tetratricopeptide (TPR) repeat protein